jgi:hypothetical protein
MLALTSITGKLGSAVLSSILEHNLLDPSQLVLCTSSNLSGTPSKLKVPNCENSTSTPQTQKPSPAARSSSSSLPQLSARFQQGAHISSINAALSAGVPHIYYSSLAFGPSSKAGVMRAHLRTEAYLAGLEKEGKVKVTVIREGLYNESWPLYLGYFDPKGDQREEVVVAGDAKVCWTAMVVSEGRMVYLCNAPEMARTLGEIAGLVGKARGREVRVRVVVRVVGRSM